jgi:hypothetical protein
MGCGKELRRWVVGEAPRRVAKRSRRAVLYGLKRLRDGDPEGRDGWPRGDCVPHQRTKRGLPSSSSQLGAKDWSRWAARDQRETGCRSEAESAPERRLQRRIKQEQRPKHEVGYVCGICTRPRTDLAVGDLEIGWAANSVTRHKSRPWVVMRKG